jgi:hypothetical protein
MIINDFNVVSVSIFPAKAKPPLIIDPHAMLACSFSLQSFKPVARRRSHIGQRDSGIELPQLALRHSLDRTEARNPLPAMEPVGVFRPEAPNHANL